MYRGIVIIPFWQRPEFLGACLHYIQQCEGWKDFFYLFAGDNGASTKNMEIIHPFPVRKRVTIQPVKHPGNSYNILTSYQNALEITASYDMRVPIYLIEEDIFVAPDFFDFHERVNSECNSFFVSGCANQNEGEQVEYLKWLFMDKDIAIYRHASYQSLGVSFYPETLRQIAAHATPEYFNDMSGYCQHNFFKNILPKQNCEQDGLIHRILLETDSFGIYPVVPRAYHAGYYGYHREGQTVDKTKPLQEQIEQLLQMTADEMNNAAGQHKDIIPCEMIDRKAKDFVLIN